MKKIFLLSWLLLAGMSMTMAQVSLTFNPDKGTRYEYAYELSQDIKQNVMGQNIAMKQDMVIIYNMEVTEKSKEETTVAFVYKDIVYDLSSAMMNMKYDSKSENNGASAAAAIIEKLFGGMLNQPFQVVLLPDGSVKSVSGMDKIMERMTAALGSDPQAAMVGQAVKQQFSNEAIKGAFEQSLKIYPQQKVKKGDSWKVNQALANAGGNLNIASTYTLKSADFRNAALEVESSVEGMNGQLQGVQAGTLELDVKTGMLKTSKIKQSIAGTIAANGMEVKMNIDGIYTCSIKQR